VLLCHRVGREIHRNAKRALDLRLLLQTQSVSGHSLRLGAAAHRLSGQFEMLLDWQQVLGNRWDMT
jgi:hypothetical protein